MFKLSKRRFKNFAKICFNIEFVEDFIKEFSEDFLKSSSFGEFLKNLKIFGLYKNFIFSFFFKQFYKKLLNLLKVHFKNSQKLFWLRICWGFYKTNFR